MPITQAAFDRLHDVISEKDSSVSVILEAGGIDEGTKALYLQRAIREENEETFHQSLDKLYSLYQNPVNKHARHLEQESIDVIRQLKLINDLYFNNVVPYTVDSPTSKGETHSFKKTKRALNHWLGVDTDAAAENVTVQIQPVIKQQIDLLIQKILANKEFSSQLKQREKLEKSSLTTDITWRQELGAILGTPPLKKKGSRLRLFSPAHREPNEAKQPQEFKHSLSSEFKHSVSREGLASTYAQHLQGLMPHELVIKAIEDPKQAKLILIAPRICEKLCSGDATETHNYLSEIAQANPDSAKLILQTDHLREKLFTDNYSFLPTFKNALTHTTLNSIAESHPSAALYILKDKDRLEDLVNNCSDPGEVLNELANKHKNSDEVVHLCQAERARVLFTSPAPQPMRNLQSPGR